jgi:hypothetical protein
MSLAKVGAFEVPEAVSAAIETPETPRQTRTAAAPLADLRTVLSPNPIAIIVVSFLQLAKPIAACKDRQRFNSCAGVTCRTVGSLSRSGVRCQTPRARVTANLSLHPSLLFAVVEIFDAAGRAGGICGLKKRSHSDSKLVAGSRGTPSISASWVSRCLPQTQGTSVFATVDNWALQWFAEYRFSFP